MPLRLISATSTDLFVGTVEAPRQVLRVEVDGDTSATIEVTGRGITGRAIAGPGRGTIEVPLEIDGAAPGDRVPLRITAEASGDVLDTELIVEAPGWTVHLISHFHYDPVWWNTQAAYTSPWDWVSTDATTRPLWERNGFALVDAHLDLALRDPDYKFVLAEVDYLKPYFDTFPHRREHLRQLLDDGRVELLGGTYNEPNTNLTGAETTIRNIVYGIGYQRDILGGDPRTAWQLDVFGHDPQFPAHLAAAGLTGSAWARGPFHQWGPILPNGAPALDDATLMQFPSEFEWLAPSGAGVLTHYMPNHYSAGWWMDSAPDLAAAEQAVYEIYRKLKPVAATRNVLIPVGTDYTPPNKWVTALHRSWAHRYVWPRFRCAIPRDFLDAVRAGLTAEQRRPSPQTRDMNPVYTGKDVSYIDTKQAQRAAEVAATDAEKLATAAVALGLGRYPHAAMDKVWRQLAYGAHHDAITGSESDQVYIDLLGGWREAFDLASAVRDAALDALVGTISAEGPAVVVVNSLGFARDGLVRVPAAPPGGPLAGDGTPLPALRDGDDVLFRAVDVPALGWRSYSWGGAEPEAGWTVADGLTIANERFSLTADPARGGTLTSIVDLDSGRELVKEPANELRSYAEYPAHPVAGEGPWHLVPTGAVVRSSESAATVRRETSPLGQRLVVTGSVDGLAYEQTTTLLHGSARVEFRTRVVDHAGSDKLLRVKFPVDLPGALPVSEVAGAVVGRGFALPDVDSAEAPWTLDNPAHTWFGVSAAAAVRLTAPDGTHLGDRAIGVAEVIAPEPADARDLVVALARAGVTATVSAPESARYGWLAVDSNLPDVRILLGDPDSNPLVAELLAEVDPALTAALDRDGAVWIPAATPLAAVWQPNADLRDLRALPALVIADGRGCADARIDATALAAPDEPYSGGTVALLTYGLPGFAVDPSGALHLSLMRSCTGWPSGVWLDPPRRTAPDGSAFQLQHWTHDFAYALVSSAADWRAAHLPADGQDFNTPLLTRTMPGGPGRHPAVHSLLTVEPERSVLLSTLKPAGNPIAGGRQPASISEVTLRLAESTGADATARITGPLAPDEWRRADLLERPDGPPARAVALGGLEIATLVGALTAPEDAAAPLLGPAGEVAQPVYSRYWLHNRGPAPMGFLPVTIAASPGLIPVDGGSVTVDVVVASNLTEEKFEGVVTLHAPDGWSVEPAEQVFRVAPSGSLAFAVTVRPPASVPEGLAFLAARIVHDGQTIEDVVTLVTGEPADLLPVPGPAPDQKDQFRGTQSTAARATGLDVEPTTTELTLRPGERQTLGLRLTNRTNDTIRGEIQLVAPWGTWDWLPDVVRGFAVAAGATSTVDFDVVVPQAAETGHAWALARVAWFGRCQYAQAVRLEVVA